MITTSDDGRSHGRIVRIALGGSVLVHLLAILLFALSAGSLTRLFARLDQRHQPKTPDETVTMSTALRLEKRPRAAAGGAKPKHVAQQPARPRPPQRPVPKVVAVAPQPVVVRKPEYPKLVLQKHELAKLAPRGPSQPPKTVKASPAPEKRVALAQQPAQAQQQAPRAVARPARAQRPTRPAKLSDAQIAKIESDLARTIADARTTAGSLSDTRKHVTPATAHRYTMDFSGIGKDLRHAQGICHPIKAWTAEGWDYYYDMCDVQEPDGSVAQKPLPWPVRYRPQADPNYGRGPDPAPVYPVPGWKPDPARPLDPDFIPYLRSLGYAV